MHEVKELNELAALPRAFPTVTVCVSVQSAPWVSTQSIPEHLRQRGISGKTNRRQEFLPVLSEQFVLERERQFARGGVPLSRCCHLHSQRLTDDTSQGGSTAHRSPSPAIPKCPQRLPSGHHEKGSAGASLRLTCPHTLLAADLRALSPLPLPLTYPMIVWLSGHLPLPGNKSSCSTPLDQAPKSSFLRLTKYGGGR